MEAWKKQRRRPVPLLRRIGFLIRNRRRRVKNPIPRLAREVGLTSDEWHAVEEGQLKVSYRTLTKILDILNTPLDVLFNANRDDFFPFVRLAMGKDPAQLTDEESDEMYEFYQELLEFRRIRSETSHGVAGNSDAKED